MTRPAESTKLCYPASGQVLRWIRLAVDISGDDGVGHGLIPAVGDYVDNAGSVRLGTMSVLADYLAGVTALQAVIPDWTVTTTWLSTPCSRVP